MITIWGRKNSFNVQKLLWLCDEIDCAWKQIDAGGQYGVNKQPEFLEKNPNGLVPLIEDGDFILWESNAIVRYLAGKMGAETLYPSELKVRADVDRWLDWQLGTVWPTMRPVFLGLVRTPEADRDTDAIQAAWNKTSDLWKMLEERLVVSPYICGAQLTLADMALGILAYRWFAMGATSEEFPHLHVWYQRLAEREAFQKYVMLPLS